MITVQKTACEYLPIILHTYWTLVFNMGRGATICALWFHVHIHTGHASETGASVHLGFDVEVIAVILLLLRLSWLDRVILRLDLSSFWFSFDRVCRSRVVCLAIISVSQG